MHIERLRKTTLSPCEGKGACCHRREVESVETRKGAAKRIFDCFEPMSLRFTKIEQARNQFFKGKCGYAVCCGELE